MIGPAYRTIGVYMHEEQQPKKVRGRPFQPGNPGRPRGSKNRTTLLVEQLIGDEAEKLTKKLVELALAGNVRCLELCLDRLSPQRSGRPVDFLLPAIKDVKDVVPAMAAITTAVNDGSLTAEEAAQLGHLLKGYVEAVSTYDIATRLERLESKKENIS
jgi:hypothetical protein